MKTHFRLKDPSANSTSIYLDISYQGSRNKWGTGISISPEHWDSEKKRPTSDIRKIKKAAKATPTIRTDLENLRVELDGIAQSISQYRQIQSGKGENLSIEGLKEHLTVKYHPSRGKPSVGNHGYQFTFLLDYSKQFIREMESGLRLTNTGKRYALGTIKNYKQFHSQIIEYEKETRQRLRLSEIEIAFYREFVQHWQSKGLGSNYIGRLIKQLKVHLRQSYKEGHHNNEIFKDSHFRTIETPVHSVYLTSNEVDKLYNTNNLTQHQEKARDVFLIGCYTALRYSDYSRLGPEHIKEMEGQNIIDIITKKTGERVYIPMRPELEALLSKYDYKIPKTYEQQVNKQIKEVCKIAGIDTVETLSENKGGREISKKVPKYQLVKTHTARRTAATLMYLANVSTLDIMKITGHKTESNFLKYIRVTKEETAIRLLEHPYFLGRKVM